MRSRWAALGRLAADKRFWLFVVSAAALQSSHQLYYGFGTLYWQELGFSDTVIGGLHLLASCRGLLLLLLLLGPLQQASAQVPHGLFPVL